MSSAPPWRLLSATEGNSNEIPGGSCLTRLKLHSQRRSLAVLCVRRVEGAQIGLFRQRRQLEQSRCSYQSLMDSAVSCIIHVQQVSTGKKSYFFFFDRLSFFDSRERSASIVSGCEGSPAFKILSTARVQCLCWLSHCCKTLLFRAF